MSKNTASAYFNAFTTLSSSSTDGSKPIASSKVEYYAVRVFGVVLRSIAMLREWRHNKIAFYPVAILPSRVFTEPHLIIYPVCLLSIFVVKGT